MSKTLTTVLYVDWTKATTRALPVPGNDTTKPETLAENMGKIVKYLDDLGTAAFTASTDYAGASHTHSTSDITSGTLGVARGGTGASTLASNAIVTGNGTSAVKTVATASGAFYATAANGAAQFGTLPIAQGGTGATSASAARTKLDVYSKSETGTQISNAINALGNVMTLKGIVATTADLPATGNAAGDMYLVGPDSTADSDDYDEYVWCVPSGGTGRWEYMGHPQFDASAYLTNVALSGAYGTNSNTWVTTLTKTANNGTAVSAGTSTVPTASTSVYGITKLSTAVDSDSTTLAATASAVKSAYNRAKIYASTPVDVSGTGNAITGLTVESGQLKATKGSTFLTQHPTITQGTNTTDSATLAYGDTFTAITGVTKDSNGHVTAYNTKTYTMPASDNTDTKVTVTDLTVSTAAATYKPTFVSAAGTGGENIMSTFAYGHKPGTTSAIGNARLELGNATASGTANNEEGQLVLYSPGTKKAILHSAALTSADVTHILPASAGTDGYLYNNIETTGSGNAVTGVSAANGKITFTKGSTFLTGHPSITVGTDTTSTASPNHGGTFTAVDSVTRDANGHVTKINTKTVTLPAGYTHPSHTAYENGLYKVTVDTLGHVTSATAVVKDDITALGIPGSNTDTKVNMIKGATTKAYLLGTSTAPTTSAQAVTSVADDAVYLGTTTGSLHATTFNGQLVGTIASSTTATTQATSDDSTKVATTAYVNDLIEDLIIHCVAAS